ncbi:MAG TPA: winged helix-turn-helix transcriptional regulator [Acidimicrobiia bacterium]|nr:winged helix-turn-helix transcriptional regulator [Acidimicrobiia bacterium]
MATTRTYSDACGIARALDVVGSRWALLIIRELLFGPLRFSDLESALPRASTNILADRLRELSDSSVVTRRRLPPPAGTTVYELTDWGRKLEPVLNDLGAWGLRIPTPEPATLGPTSVLLFLRGSAKVDTETTDMVIGLILDGRVFTVTVHDGQLHIYAGEPNASDASLECDPATFNALLSGDLDLKTAIDNGRAAIDGDRPKLELFLATVPDERRYLPRRGQGLEPE